MCTYSKEHTVSLRIGIALSLLLRVFSNEPAFKNQKSNAKHNTQLTGIFYFKNTFPNLHILVLVRILDIINLYSSVFSTGYDLFSSDLPLHL